MKGKTQKLLGTLALVTAIIVGIGTVMAGTYQNHYGPNNNYDYNWNHYKNGQRYQATPNQNNGYQNWYPGPWMRGHHDGYHGGPAYYGCGWCPYNGYNYRHHYNGHYGW